MILKVFPAMARNKGSILIVEDNSDDEELMLFALAKAGIHKGIIILRDGADAADFMSGAGIFSDRDVEEMPHIIFLDYKLPKLTGLQVLERLRSNVATASLPIIIMTISKENSIAQECIRLGATGFVHKSLAFDEFVDTVKRQIEDHCGHNS